MASHGGVAVAHRCVRTDIQDPSARVLMGEFCVTMYVWFDLLFKEAVKVGSRERLVGPRRLILAIRGSIRHAPSSGSHRDRVLGSLH